MSFQSKQLSAEMIETVVRLKKHYDKERQLGKFVSTKDAVGRTAKSLGLGVATVKRIMSRYTKSDETVVVHYNLHIFGNEHLLLLATFTAHTPKSKRI